MRSDPPSADYPLHSPLFRSGYVRLVSLLFCWLWLDQPVIFVCLYSFQCLLDGENPISPVTNESLLLPSPLGVRRGRVVCETLPSNVEVRRLVRCSDRQCRPSVALELCLVGQSISPVPLWRPVFSFRFVWFSAGFLRLVGGVDDLRRPQFNRIRVESSFGLDRRCDREELDEEWFLSPPPLLRPTMIRCLFIRFSLRFPHGVRLRVRGVGSARFPVASLHLSK